jgi:hypothetical protein
MNIRGQRRRPDPASAAAASAVGAAGRCVA